jgi:cold-inducible RNA-binding protein
MVMAKKVYVGNLGPAADKVSLKTLFSVFGTVEKAYIVSDSRTGQSKGFGFVVMKSDDEAKAAITALDGKMCGEYTVRVSEAKE